MDDAQNSHQIFTHECICVWKHWRLDRSLVCASWWFGVASKGQMTLCAASEASRFFLGSVVGFSKVTGLASKMIVFAHFICLSTHLSSETIRFFRDRVWFLQYLLLHLPICRQHLCVYCVILSLKTISSPIFVNAAHTTNILSIDANGQF